MIVRKSGACYIINNGEHAFRVNGALLNSNEASPLGSRAVMNVRFSNDRMVCHSCPIFLQIFEHVMAFQAIESP